MPSWTNRPRLACTITDLAGNLAAVRARVEAACRRAHRDPDSVAILAASKYVDAAGVAALASAGHRLFGENRVQDARAKFAELPGELRDRLELHMIGHLQSNKAATAAELFDVVETVDSIHLAEALSRAADARGAALPVLVQVNVAADPAKSGFSPGDVPAHGARLLDLPGIEVRGLMTIGPLVADAEAARPTFRALRELRDGLASRWPGAALRELSMGMSADFEVAIEEGATIVRMGTALFGEHS